MTSSKAARKAYVLTWINKRDLTRSGTETVRATDMVDACDKLRKSLSKTCGWKRSDIEITDCRI